MSSYYLSSVIFFHAHYGSCFAKKNTIGWYAYRTDRLHIFYFVKEMRSCTPGSKKFAKRVRACNGEMKCVRYGDRSMTIKKHIPSRKRSFCARHKCALKTEPATPGYQSCKKWNCKVGSCKSRRKSRTTSRRRRSPQNPRIRNPKTGKMVLKSGQVGKAIMKKRKSKAKAPSRRYSKCWSGYKRKGWKIKNGRRVPNCVKA